MNESTISTVDVADELTNLQSFRSQMVSSAFSVHECRQIQ